jgi:hypothetical protein
MSVQVSFLGRLWDRDVIEKIISEAIQASANPALQFVREDTPVETGRLFRSIKATAKPKFLEVGSKGVPYAGYVEFGTRFMDAREYLQQNIPDIQDVLTRELIRAVDGLS